MWKKVIALSMLTCFLLGCRQPSVEDAYGSPIELLTPPGKWLVINYWASWCKPCYTEIPELNRLQADHHDKLMVLGINYDHMPSAELRAFAEQQHVTYALVTTDIGQQYGIDHVSQLPATFLINPQGQLVQSLYGPQTASDVLKLILS